VGPGFCDTILDLNDPEGEKLNQVKAELEKLLPKTSDSESEDESDAEKA
jgi:hypothetical protein